MHFYLLLVAAKQEFLLKFHTEKTKSACNLANMENWATNYMYKEKRFTQLQISWKKKLCTFAWK